MEKIKTLLVDDEYLALNLLENFVSRLPDLEIIDKVKSPVKALEILQSSPVDLLFLDIQMPTLSGTNLLKTLPYPPVTIFTTAYSEYAPQAFDLNATDYLLKPFSFERFLQSINKARQQLRSKRQIYTEPTSFSPSTQKLEKAFVQPSASSPKKEFISIKVDGRIQKVFFQDIIYIEGLREYVRLVCEDKKKYVTLESLKNMEGRLPTSDFLRVHKSYIIAKSKAISLDGNMLEIGAYRIPISRSKREFIIGEIF